MGLHINTNQELIKQIFKQMDKDKSNSIDKTELGEFLKILLASQKKMLIKKMSKK